jgi:zinc transporter ZupT
MILLDWKEKLLVLLVICIITGVIGTSVGVYIASAMGTIGGTGMFGLIGFLVGFFAPIFIYMDVN